MSCFNYYLLSSVNLTNLTALMCVLMNRLHSTLTLRIWDIYILEGERILTAMSYTILKLHKSNSSDIILINTDYS